MDWRVCQVFFLDKQKIPSPYDKLIIHLRF